MVLGLLSLVTVCFGQEVSPSWLEVIHVVEPGYVPVERTPAVVGEKLESVLVHHADHLPLLRKFLDVASTHYDEVLVAALEPGIIQIARRVAMRSYFLRRYVDEEDLRQEAWVHLPLVMSTMRDKVESRTSGNALGYIGTAFQRKMVGVVLKARDKLPFIDLDLNHLVEETDEPEHFSGYKVAADIRNISSTFAETVFRNGVQFLREDDAYLMIETKIKRRSYLEVAGWHVFRVIRVWEKRGLKTVQKKEMPVEIRFCRLNQESLFMEVHCSPTSSRNTIKRAIWTPTLH